MKEAMRHFDGRPLFLPRNVDTIAYPLEPHEQDLYDAVTDYVANGLEKAESTRNRNVGLALTVLQRRLASSLYAITCSLKRRRDRLAEELEKAGASGRIVPRPEIALDFDADDADGEPTEEQEDILSAASTAQTVAELEAEVAQLDVLLVKAHAAMARGPEKKLREFLDVVRSQTVKDRDEKILVFTDHRDTLIYLTRKLRELGYSVCNIHGLMKLQDRIAAEKEFRGPT